MKIEKVKITTKNLKLNIFLPLHCRFSFLNFNF